MNNYRVDRSNGRFAPVGMNSIVYIGDSWLAARSAYEATEPGRDVWGQPNAAYGVVLSVWDERKNTYVVKCDKGLA